MLRRNIEFFISLQKPDSDRVKKNITNSKNVNERGQSWGGRKEGRTLQKLPINVTKCIKGVRADEVGI